MIQGVSEARSRELGKLGRLLEVWPSRGWSWDRRLECVASTFALESAEIAWEATQRFFVTVWDERGLATAPSLVRQVAQNTGGVRSDQYLLTGGPTDHMMVYGLWWPWGGEGTNISMRVGLAGRVGFDDHMALRELFHTADD